jgi:hypothetical protein
VQVLCANGLYFLDDPRNTRTGDGQGKISPGPERYVIKANMKCEVNMHY